MDTKTYAVSAPVKVDITLNDGTVYHLKSGLNVGVPEDVATHWYAKASGCSVMEEAEAKAKAKAEKADGKSSKKGVKTEDAPTLAERAAAVGLDDISGLSEDEALKLVEEAEAKAKADP